MADQRPRKRPFGVTVIAVLLVFNGVLGLVQLGRVVADFLEQHPDEVQVDMVVEASESLTAIEWATLPFTVAGLIMAWGLLRLHPRAWTATMFLQGLFLAIQLFDYFKGEPVYLNLLVSVLTVLYLNQSDVQLVFRKEYAPDPQEAMLT